jgi:hypothetical protein
MRLRTVKCAGVGLALGFGVALVRVLLGVDWKDATFGAKGVGPWKLLNLPALRFADWWTGLGLPPSNEAAWVIPPAMMVLAQWTLVGLVVGLCWGRRLGGKAEVRPGAEMTTPSEPPVR